MAAVSTGVKDEFLESVTIASGSAEGGSKTRLSSELGLREGALFLGGRCNILSVGTDGLCFTWRRGRPFSSPSNGKEGKLFEFALDL